MTTPLNIIRRYQAQRDRISSAWKLRHSPLALPGQTPPPSLSDFTVMMDSHTRELMSALTGDGEPWSPLDWEAFLELLPNMRKLLNLTGEGGYS